MFWIKLNNLKFWISMEEVDDYIDKGAEVLDYEECLTNAKRSY